MKSNYVRYTLCVLLLSIIVSACMNSLSYESDTFSKDEFYSNKEIGKIKNKCLKGSGEDCFKLYRISYNGLSDVTKPEDAFNWLVMSIYLKYPPAVEILAASYMHSKSHSITPNEDVKIFWDKQYYLLVD